MMIRWRCLGQEGASCSFFSFILLCWVGYARTWVIGGVEWDCLFFFRVFLALLACVLIFLLVLCDV